MAYIVRIRGVEVVCETLDQLDEIVERYGGEGAPAAPKRANGGAAGPAGDAALLRELVNVGSTGLGSQTIGEMIGARGKGVPVALKRWALRVGLTQDESNFPLEPARPQGGRGWRLNDGAITIARHLLGQKA